MEDAQPAGSDGRRRFQGVNAPAGGLAADEPHLPVFKEVVKAADGVGAAAHAGDHRVGELPLLLEDLLLDLFGDDGLEIPDNGGERVGAHDRAQAVMGIIR